MTGKPHRAWVVVHGSVHGAGWLGGGVVSSVVGAVVKRRFSSTAPASITTETSASPLLSVDGAGAVDAVGGVKS